MATSVGDEGGFAPDLPSNAAALEVIAEAVANAGYVLGEDIHWHWIVLPPNFIETVNIICRARDALSQAKDFPTIWLICGAHPIVSIEDGLDESDWAGWAYLTQQLGDKVNSWVMIYSLPTPAY